MKKRNPVNRFITISMEFITQNVTVKYSVKSNIM